MRRSHFSLIVSEGLIFNSVQLGLIRISSFVERLGVINKPLKVQSFILFQVGSYIWRGYHSRGVYYEISQTLFTLQSPSPGIKTPGHSWGIWTPPPYHVCFTLDAVFLRKINTHHANPWCYLAEPYSSTGWLFPGSVPGVVIQIWKGQPKFPRNFVRKSLSVKGALCITKSTPTLGSFWKPRLRLTGSGLGSVCLVEIPHPKC